MNSAVALVSEV